MCGAVVGGAWAATTAAKPTRNKRPAVEVRLLPDGEETAAGGRQLLFPAAALQQLFGRPCAS